ncbi:unnamed protein product [Acanthoscelides obtectus]|uniref:Crossover junction endonuclease EME1 n=1 Tax=Acanthoscelides obtectus TaxID=200917 RepID=A0A9P0PF05_ACAOB|nr:unnamed protein product [Acanthoscelides obtectus]CAK1660095.1 Crossover junction endonuclease EME1 [Acanthoscelides obtectus]
MIFRQEQQEKYQQQNLYFKDSNKDTVRVDKNGNGLGRLWHQMLTMFPMARLEHAEAITAVYPTPKALFQGYNNCENKEAMLQELQIRRGQGPLTSVRKLGPELSKKCCNFFNSTENTLI